METLAPKNAGSTIGNLHGQYSTVILIYDINNNDPKDFEDIIKNMTPADIQDFVNRMFDNPDNLDVVFTPKK